jgi:hypothetical protein
MARYAKQDIVQHPLDALSRNGFDLTVAIKGRAPTGMGTSTKKPVVARETPGGAIGPSELPWERESALMFYARTQWRIGIAEFLVSRGPR